MNRTLSTLALAITTTACAVSRQQAAQMGAEESARLNQQLPIVRNASADQYVEQLGQLIVNHTPDAGQNYEFQLYRSNEVNAFALPGGYIYVSTGLVNAAASEVEDYTRVITAGLPDSEIAGAVAGDLVHLLAELLDNALRQRAFRF